MECLDGFEAQDSRAAPGGDATLQELYPGFLTLDPSEAVEMRVDTRRHDRGPRSGTGQYVEEPDGA
ncbi:MAG: hypothetical protein ACE5JX_04705, partial [Acidobacteriota bacterium]